MQYRHKLFLSLNTHALATDIQDEVAMNTVSAYLNTSSLSLSLSLSRARSLSLSRSCSLSVSRARVRAVYSLPSRCFTSACVELVELVL